MTDDYSLAEHFRFVRLVIADLFARARNGGEHLDFDFATAVSTILADQIRWAQKVRAADPWQLTAEESAEIDEYVIDLRELQSALEGAAL